MASNQPEKAAGVSVQQLSRRVQVAVTEALRTLDKVKAIDPAGQDEVDSLRSVVWSDLTGLEAEFNREEGPRAEVLDRFFTHLLSNGDYVGQIESLAEALLGGAPPPVQPPPDSPVAGLFRLHGALADIRRQWQDMAPPQPTRRPATTPVAPPAPRREEVGPPQRASHPVPPPAAPLPPRREAGPQQVVSHPAAAPVAPPPPRRDAGPQQQISHPDAPPAAPSPPRREAAASRDDFFDEMGLPPSRQETPAPPPNRGRALAERPLVPQARRQNNPDRFADGLGFSGSTPAHVGADIEPARPRVLVSFVTVFIILALMGVGVIYLGLNNGPQASNGIVPSAVPTFSINIPTTTPQPTPTLSSAAPQLQVTGNPLIIPCPGKGTNGFVLRNTGGRRLNWSATVNTEPGASAPVTLTPASGVLFGPQNSGTDAVTVTVKATTGNTDGTITISNNAGDPVVIVYHIHGC
ncbi:MAG TPA: hypothetical protein VKT82_34280 [Ktedonobacterales bacterium]|nr:hypothetical protein [Ktedonobacterales bacterium]